MKITFLVVGLVLPAALVACVIVVALAINNWSGEICIALFSLGLICYQLLLIICYYCFP
jgi:hypothetical protein